MQPGPGLTLLEARQGAVTGVAAAAGAVPAVLAVTVCQGPEAEHGRTHPAGAHPLGQAVLYASSSIPRVWLCADRLAGVLCTLGITGYQ